MGRLLLSVSSTKKLMNLAESIEYGIKIIPCIREPRYIHLISGWLEQIHQEIETEEFDCVIVISQMLPLTEDEGFVEYIKDMFPRYISLAYDFDVNIISDLENDVFNESGTYAKTFEYFTNLFEEKDSASLKNQILSQPFMKCHSNEGEKGRIHITHFNESVTNCIAGKGNSFVFHPPLADNWWSKKRTLKEGEPFTVGFINPIKRKGVMQLRYLIEENPDIQFFVLSGGWNEGINNFRDYMKLSADIQGKDLPNNFKLVEYVKDIRSFYDSIDLFLFPSISEGYGQVASESIVRGTPVLCKDYPTIREATLDSAFYIPAKDYFNYGLWNDALHEIIDNYDSWLEQTAKASGKLKKRQNHETQGLSKFLETIVQDP